MKISTRGRYAIRLMLELAMRSDGELVSVKDVAASQEISEKYMEQIIAPLKKAGYVKSVRGAQGGYCLARRAEEYTVGMILRIIEGSMAPVDCLDDPVNQCQRAGRCVTLRLWTMVDDAIKGVIDKVTLQDLVDWQMEMGQDYQI